MRPCVLYRHFDRNGELLYVGIALNPFGRLTEHQITAGWYRQIVTVSFEHYESVAMARLAERSAIIHEIPKHNVQHALRLHHKFETGLVVQDVL